MEFMKKFRIGTGLQSVHILHQWLVFMETRWKTLALSTRNLI